VDVFLRLQGEKTAGIKLIENHLQAAAIPVQLDGRLTPQVYEIKNPK
jgi:hypothetical protein